MHASLIDAYRTEQIIAGDVLSIKTDGEEKEYVYMLYSQENQVHFLFPWPLREEPFRGSPVFYRDDDIKEWEKVDHVEPEDFRKVKETTF